jgi:hypothetical protein
MCKYVNIFPMHIINTFALCKEYKLRATPVVGVVTQSNSKHQNIATIECVISIMVFQMLKIQFPSQHNYHRHLTATTDTSQLLQTPHNCYRHLTVAIDRHLTVAIRHLTVATDTS